MRKYLLLFAVYSESDGNIFVDCLGTYDTYEAAQMAMDWHKGCDDDEPENETREYRIKSINI